MINISELKYSIGEVDYYKVNEMFKSVLTPDSNNKENVYIVRSLYFDSINNDYYVEVIFNVCFFINDETMYKIIQIVWNNIPVQKMF